MARRHYFLDSYPPFVAVNIEKRTKKTIKLIYRQTRCKQIQGLSNRLLQMYTHAENQADTVTI